MKNSSYQNYSLGWNSDFLCCKLFCSCDCFWMATVGKWHKKQSNFDKNRDFDPLGVEIELWVINPKSCARSTYGGLGGVRLPKFPTVFPKIEFEGFFTLSCKKKCAKMFRTKNFLLQKNFFQTSFTFLVL